MLGYEDMDKFLNKYLNVKTSKVTILKISRNFEAGISPTIEACRIRTYDSDFKNANYVLENSNKEKCFTINNN